MNGKWKVLILTGMLVLISGFVISFKHYQLTEDFRRQVQHQKSLEISAWVSELLMQKVSVLESSVSNLDKSTTETMKRIGVQYFAYAQKNTAGKLAGKWKVKWKNLGEIETPKIKEQVAGFSFDDFSVTKRSWVRLGKNTVLISPVANAESQKMKAGFLIFSLESQRLENLGALSTEVALFSSKGESLSAKDPKWLKVKGLFQEKKDGTMAIVENRETSYLRAASFSTALQMWVVHFQPFPQESYITSSSALTFFLCFLVLGLLAGLLTYKLPFENLNLLGGAFGSRRRSYAAGESDAVLRVVLHRMRNDLNSLRDQIGSMAEPMRKLDVFTAIDTTKNWLGASDTKTTKEVRDFGKCIEVITLLKQSELAKAEISVQTQIEEGAAVICSIEAVEEFILRLVDNSISTLSKEDEKWIHIGCTKEGDHYQFIYRDSRSGELPQLQDDAQLLTSDNPFEDIHGILAFGHFAFGSKMTSSQDELNIGLRLAVDEPTTTILPVEDSASAPGAKPEIETTSQPPVKSPALNEAKPEPVVQAQVASENMVSENVYEIDMDSDYELEDIEVLQPLPPKTLNGDQGFQAVEIPVQAAATPAPEKGFLVPPPLPQVETSPVNSEVDTMMKDFELKEFNFDETLPSKPEVSDVAFTDSAKDWPEQLPTQGEKEGLVEFTAGDMKLKIRSPKKRTPNVSS